MNKSIRIIALLLFTSIIISCESKPKYEQKFSEEKRIITCNGFDDELLKEITYRFEEFAETNYDFRNQDILDVSIGNFLFNSSYGYLPYAERFDEEMLSFIASLKNIEDLWQVKNGETYLNTKHPVVQCLVDQMPQGTFNNAFKALVESNTIRHASMATLIRGEFPKVSEQNAVRAYIALDIFFARVVSLDYEQPKAELIEYMTDYNKARAAELSN